jgi:hypothetical protein
LGQPASSNELLFRSLSGLPVDRYKKGFKTVLKSIGLSLDDTENPVLTKSYLRNDANHQLTILLVYQNRLFHFQSI